MRLQERKGEPAGRGRHDGVAEGRGARGVAHRLSRFKAAGDVVEAVRLCRTDPQARRLGSKRQGYAGGRSGRDQRRTFSSSNVVGPVAPNSFKCLFSYPSLIAMWSHRLVAHLDTVLVEQVLHAQ
jgi:hypothetical protein